MFIRPIKKIMEYRKLTHSLIAPALTLLVDSCSDNQGVRLRYEAERLCFQADRQMTIAARGAGTLIEARTLTFIADLYRRWDDFKRSTELLVSLFEKLPETYPGRNSLNQAASIYRNQLNQPDMAGSIVDRLRSMLLQPEEGWGT